MSHELRTPLNAVIGFSELLTSMVSDSKQRSFLNSIKTAGRNLLMLINNILDLSKIEAGKIELEQSVVNLKRLFDEIEQIFSIKVSEKNLGFSIDSTDLPDFLYLDEIRTRQILLNLVGNAIKFTNEGYVKISANVTVKREDSVDLVISILDTGIGIPTKDQQKVFNSFEQQSNQNAIKYGGTGLGLSITKRLVELMNGKINLTSSPEKGSQFDVVIPDVKIASTKDRIPEKFEFHMEDLKFGQAKALVVDDIESNRMLLSEFLSKANLDVTMANNGQEAVLSAKELKPAIIFMDIRMPVMNGIDAANQLKSDVDTAGIPIIALTASSTKNDKTIALDQGFDDFVSKPIDFKKLIKVLSKYLEHTINPKEAIRIKTPPVISPVIAIDKIHQPGILLNSLKLTILPVLQTLEKAFIISNFKQLGVKLEKLSQIHNVLQLSTYASHIQSLVDSFDIKGMNKNIKTLTVLITAVIKELEDLNEEEYPTNISR
jgi:CheY-like chemotaxis protein